MTRKEVQKTMSELSDEIAEEEERVEKVALSDVLMRVHIELHFQNYESMCPPFMAD